MLFRFLADVIYTALRSQMSKADQDAARERLHPSVLQKLRHKKERKKYQCGGLRNEGVSLRTVKVRRLGWVRWVGQK